MREEFFRCWANASKVRFCYALCLAIISGVVVLLLPQSAMQWVVKFSGYYFIVGILSGCAYYGWKTWLGRSGSTKMIRKDLLYGGLAVLVGTWVVFVHATLDYKIAMDDYLLASTAKSLHETREVTMVTLGNYWGDAFLRQEVEVDKRPWFYPFCVSVLHDVFGYSESHPFIFNSIICVLFLGLVYIFGQWLGGRPAGVLSVLLWASLPLLSQNATGAGMEMLNLCMLQLLCVLSVLYLRRPCASLESLLSLTSVLLVYTRYESGLFIFPTIAVIALGWWRSGRVFLGWGTILSSVALIAVTMQTRLYSMNDAAWELGQGVSAPFGWDHLVANIPHALNFFFSYDMSLANSLLLGLLAVPAILAFMFLLRTELSVYWRENPAGLVSAIFIFFILLQFMITLSFHAGQLDQRFVSRYSLPFHFAIISATVAVLAYAAVRFRFVWPSSLTVAGMFILIFTLPSNSQGIFNNKNFVVREFNWMKALSENELKPKSLYVDRYTVFWSLNEVSVVSMPRFMSGLPVVKNYLDDHSFSEVYVIRRSKYSSLSFKSEDPLFDELQKSVSLELVAERSFRPLYLTQIYRIKEFQNMSSSE
jgi:hypothetical protein